MLVHHVFAETNSSLGYLRARVSVDTNINFIALCEITFKTVIQVRLYFCAPTFF